MSRLSELDLDLQRIEQIRASIPQRRAVAKLVGYCEAIAASGLVGEQLECKLRAHIAETLSAFGMQHNDERNAA